MSKQAGQNEFTGYSLTHMHGITIDQCNMLHPQKSLDRALSKTHLVGRNMEGDLKLVVRPLVVRPLVVRPPKEPETSGYRGVQYQGGLAPGENKPGKPRR